MCPLVIADGLQHYSILADFVTAVHAPLLGLAQTLWEIGTQGK